MAPNACFRHFHSNCLSASDPAVRTSTRFAGDDRFTVNFGVGYRFLYTDSVAFHLDFRDHLFDIDLLGEDKTTHNLEATLGVTVFF